MDILILKTKFKVNYRGNIFLNLKVKTNFFENVTYKMRYKRDPVQTKHLTKPYTFVYRWIIFIEILFLWTRVFAQTINLK
jgi:hypothetical protein